MGDKEMKSMKYFGAKSPIFPIVRKDIAWLVTDMIDAAIKIPPLRDEIYMQLCKQLTRNPSFTSRFKGWLLFSILLHGFPPSLQLVLYIENFISKSFENERRIIATQAAVSPC
jgi:hypothetical protein